MNYQCGACQHRFTEREALCEDWRIAERSFVCPDCSLYLEKRGFSWKNTFISYTAAGLSAVIANWIFSSLSAINAALGYMFLLFALVCAVFVASKLYKRTLVVKPYPDQEI